MSDTVPLVQHMVAEHVKLGFLARHRYIRALLIVLLSVSASFVLVNLVVFAAQLGRVPMFTRINGVNVGFKTIDQARSDLERYHTLRRLNVNIGEKSYSLSAVASGVAIDASKSLSEATQPKGWLRIPVVNLVANTTVEFGTYYTVNNKELEATLSEYVTEHNVPAEDAKLVLPSTPDQDVAVVPEKKGYTLGVSDVAQTVVTAVTENNFEIAVEPKVAEPKVKADDLRPLAAQVRSMTKTTSNELRSIIEQYALTHPGAYNVAVVELGGGNRSAFYEADDVLITASTYKVFAAYIALKKVEQGKLRMDSPTAYGTLDYCVQRMILMSDNNCGIAIGEKIGWREMHNVARAAGFSRTSLTSNTGNLYGAARDLTQLLVRLHNGELINAEHTKYLFDLMKKQVYRDGIPTGSRGAVVANKVGFLDAYNHDTGIVYGPKATYALTILTTGSSYGNISRLASQIYDFYNK